MTSYAAACCCDEEGGPGCTVFASLDFSMLEFQRRDILDYDAPSLTAHQELRGSVSGSCGLRTVTGLGAYSSTHPSLNNPQPTISFSDITEVRGPDENGCGEEFVIISRVYNGGPVSITARLNENFGYNARSVWTQAQWPSNDYCGFELDPAEYGRIATVRVSFPVDTRTEILTYGWNGSECDEFYTLNEGTSTASIGTFARLFLIGNEQDPCDVGMPVADSGMFCEWGSQFCGEWSFGNPSVPFCDARMLPRSYTNVDDQSYIDPDGNLAGKIFTVTSEKSGSVSSIQFMEDNPFP